MQFTLNIGHAPSNSITTRVEPLTVREIFAALRGAGFIIKAHRIAQSETEVTSVVVVDTGNGIRQYPHDPHRAIFNVSAALSQDCIAVLSSNGTGCLIGPNASAWGEFNGDYFIPFVEVLTRCAA